MLFLVFIAHFTFTTLKWDFRSQFRQWSVRMKGANNMYNARANVWKPQIILHRVFNQTVFQGFHRLRISSGRCGNRKGAVFPPQRRIWSAGRISAPRIAKLSAGLSSRCGKTFSEPFEVLSQLFLTALNCRERNSLWRTMQLGAVSRYDYPDRRKFVLRRDGGGTNPLPALKLPDAVWNLRQTHTNLWMTVYLA